MTKHVQSLLLLPISLALLIPLLHSTTLAALSPATAPAQPTATPPATAPPNNNNTTTTTTDIVQILKQANTFNIFLRLMKTTQLVNQLNSQLLTIKSGGITILAADDGAFSELKPGFLNSLSDGKKLELLQFHVLPDFVSNSNFDTLTNPVRTLAGNKPGKVELNVVSYGGVVNISTGTVNTTITGVVYSDNKHLAVYRVGKVLVPSEFSATNKTIAARPAKQPVVPVTDAAKAPKPEKEKPSLAPENSSAASSSQVVPTVTSWGVRIGVSGKWVGLVVGVVFVGVFAA